MTPRHDERTRFRAALGVALVGVIDDALARGDVTTAERLVIGLQRKVPAVLSTSSPIAARYLATALHAARLIASRGGGG